MLTLIVGGESALRKRLGQHLQLRQAELLTTGDYDQALQMALANPPDLILCGLITTWDEGHRFLHQVRNEPGLRSTPLVLFTADKPGSADQELLIAHGATGLMTVSEVGELFWQEIETALERVRVEKALRRQQALEDEQAFLSHSRRLLGPGLGPEWNDYISEGDRFRTMVESSPDWFWEFDKDANFTYASPRIRQLLGYDPEEIIGQNAFDLMDPDEAARVHQHFDPIARRYQPFSHLENTNRHKNGQEVVIESSGTPIFGSDGQFLGYRGIDRDITERIHSEQALRESERRLREAQQVARLGYYRYDIHSETWERSEMFDQIFGISAETPMNMTTWLNLVHPDQREDLQTYLAQTVFRWRQPFDRSYKIVRPSDGKTRWLHGRGQLETNSDNKILCITGTVQDITRQKLAEQQLVETLREARTARKQLDALLASVADALVVTDAHQRILLINPAAEQLLGRQLADIQFQPVSTLVDEQVFIDQLQTLLLGEQANPTVEFSLPTPGSDIARVVQARVALVQGEQGQATELIAILRDITRERQADRMKSEFISIAAHELRTPLTAVMGYAELLEQEQSFGQFSAAQRQEYLETILQKCDQLRIIVDDLLSLSRIEAGRPISLDKKPCQLVAELKRIITSHGLDAAGHAYSMEFPDQEVTIDCDSNKLEQVMDNLLSNAAKYSPGAASIRIRGERQDDRFLVSVTDSGIGMTPEQRERMFDKFYRADMTETSVGGLGLGMSISKNIIEAHGGRIWVESTPGEGTTVSFTLPI